MMTKSWIYDGMIYIYALSLLFYFSDFLGKNQRNKRMGTGLLILVWIMQTIFYILRAAKLKYIPVIGMFDTLFLISWFMVTFSLLMYYFVRFDLLVFFINIIAFTILIFSIFSDSSAILIETGWNIQDELLYLHILLAVCSYSVFLIGAVFSSMYLFLHRKLKTKQLSIVMRRLPSLDRIEIYIFRTAVIGSPLLIASLVLGIVWIAWIGDMRMLFDPKVFNSFLILAAYCFYLVQRMTRHSSGNKLALWNLAAFIVVILNFVFSNYVSDFHQWVWR
jgi:HemX protein